MLMINQNVFVITHLWVMIVQEMIQSITSANPAKYHTIQIRIIQNPNPMDLMRGYLIFMLLFNELWIIQCIIIHIVRYYE